jgi:hypothetical protein
MMAESLVSSPLSVSLAERGVFPDAREVSCFFYQ